MNTAEIVGRQQMESHWRLYEHQLQITEALKPIGKLWIDKMREAYPELFPAVGQGALK